MFDQTFFVERVVIDDKYTYEYSEGRVSLLRYGKKWVTDPDCPRAWIAAAGEIERLREALDATKEV